MEPLFGQLLRSVPASMCPEAVAHTLLLSKELCQVAFPPKGTVTPGLGFALMLAKWVMIWKFCPRISVNRVA